MVLFILLAGVVVDAQQPQLTNSKLLEGSANAGLQPAVADLLKADAGPAWMAYSIPSIPGEHHLCCFNGHVSDNNYCCGTCRLEKHGESTFMGKTSGDCKATLASTVVLFLRFEHGQIDQVRSFSPECQIDAGGKNVYWLTDVQPAQSVAYLESLLSQSPRRSELDSVVSAIAFHNDPSADAALEKLIKPAQDTEARGQAAFWIGLTRGSHGLDVLLSSMKSDQNHDFLEKAVFAISQSTERDRADNELIRLARQDTRPIVREQAIFWLAQEAGKKAAGTITDSIENDPDTDVKKKAVFALSEMPPEEGIPLLID
ncbi:MAG TPA: hypothetical protein VGF08_01380, partial [Terriglobales bacterium]